MSADTLNVCIPPKPVTPEPILVDEREARRMLGNLCAKTLWNLRRAGVLRCVKIGAKNLYELAELRRFVAAQADT